MSEETTTETIDTTATDAPVTDAPAADSVAETAPADAAAAPADAPKAKGKKGKAAAAAEADPTLEEAEAMFKERPGLDSVRTQAGWLTRDGQLTVLTPALAGE